VTTVRRSRQAGAPPQKPSAPDPRVADDPQLVSLARPAPQAPEQPGSEGAATTEAPGGISCPNCRQDNFETQSFCIRCGAYLKGPRQPRRRRRLSHRPIILLAGGLVALALVGMGLTARRFREIRRAWRPIKETRAPASQAKPFADIPRHPNARPMAGQSRIHADAQVAPALKGATIERYVVPEDIEQVAAWYRTHLGPGWQEGRFRDLRRDGCQFRRLDSDRTATAVVLGPSFWDAAGKTPVANMTGVLVTRIPLPKPVSGSAQTDNAAH